MNDGVGAGDTTRTEPAPADPATARTRQRLRGEANRLTATALRRLDEELPWYQELRAQERSWVGLLASNGIRSFIAWYDDPDHPQHSIADIFSAAPAQLARTVSLQHTLQLVRIIVEVVESDVPHLAEPGQEAHLRDAVLRYSREIAFTGAEVYARAAEVRGAWDSRLEAMIIDAIVRGDSDDALGSRVAALGWGGEGETTVAVGTVSAHRLTLPDQGAELVRRAARRVADDVLVGVHGDRLVLVLGGDADTQAAAASLETEFGPGPIVLGPAVSGLAHAGQSAQAALAGLVAARGWAGAPRPVLAEDLLPERAMIGDQSARRALIDDVYRPLANAGESYLNTVTTYLDGGRSLEGSARVLFVHPNTVRYRLKRVAEITGWDPADPRESFVVHIALVLGRLSALHEQI